MRIVTLAAATLLAVAACTARPPRGTPATTATSPAPSATGALPDFGGADVAWPSLKRATPAPPALGAIVTTSRWTLANGSTLASGITLPRVGGTAAAPEILTPCGRDATFGHGTFTTIAPAGEGRTVVLVDPGHGGREPGALAQDGTHEATRALEVSTLVARDLSGVVDDVVLTRTQDRDTSLSYRVALGDALRATLAVSIHFNADPDGPSPAPGTATFGSLADSAGRRAAGVLYAAERQYLDTLTPRIGGRWVANADAGALYRIGAHGDYYFQLRRSHRPWVISESLYITNPPEAGLLADPAVREGLAAAIAHGVDVFVNGTAPGSGWKTPLPRPQPPGGASHCTDPA